MLETKRLRRKPYTGKRFQQGATALEFGLVAIAFFGFVFGVIELARLMFLYNTLPEVTRRAASAAASTDFSKPAEVDRVRFQSIFRDSAGSLMLMKELTDESIRIDYMALRRNADNSLTMTAIPTASLPANPSENRKTCLVDPNSSTCIRIVRVRVCDAANSTGCDAIQFDSMIPFFELSIPLPVATTLAKAQSLGL